MKNIILLLIIFCSIPIIAQDEKYTIGLGIVTTSILGNNPATAPMLQSDTTKQAIVGGSFEMVQSGIQAQYALSLDDDADWKLPVSVEYTFFSGRQRFQVNMFIVDKYSHTVNSFNLNTGIQRVLYKMDFAKAKLYAGIEARMTYLHNIQFEALRNYLQLPDLNERITYSKDNALRFGGLFRLGIEGRLKNDYYINTGCAFSLTNLIGADDNRRELLTPIITNESKETLVSNFHFYLLIQYNFR